MVGDRHLVGEDVLFVLSHGSVRQEPPTDFRHEFGRAFQPPIFRFRHVLAPLRSALSARLDHRHDLRPDGLGQGREAAHKFSHVRRQVRGRPGGVGSGARMLGFFNTGTAARRARVSA